MEGSKPTASSFSNLPKERKTGFVLLLVFGIIAVVLGMLQIRNTVYAPFALSNKVPASVKEQIVDNNTDYQKVNDTDKDGLSDFDEQYVFGTSAYLYDTFGYGISDKDVVTRGFALCPRAGQSCAGDPTTEGTNVVTSNTSTILGSLPKIEAFGVAEQDFVGTPPPDLDKILTDPQELRKLLLQTGKVDQDSLNKVSDKDLLLMVSQIISTSTQATAKDLPTVNFSSTSTR